MRTTKKINPIEILQAYEVGDDLPVLEVGVSDQDNSESTAFFIKRVEELTEQFTNGASAEWCVEQIRDAFFGLNEWWEAESTAKSILGTMAFGSVYALVNESIPELFKVGFTTGDAHSRAAQISAATGVPTPFKVLFSYETINARRVETGIHELLADKRVNEGREFFRCNLGELGRAFESAITAEYAAYGFSMDGPVVHSTDFYVDADMARHRCERYLNNRAAFFHPSPASPAESPF